MAGIETGIAIFEQVFFYTSFLSQYWISQLVIIVASMAIVTRKLNDWKVLALPMMIGWQYFGMFIPWIFYVIATLVFVVEVMSMRAVEGALGAVRDGLGIIGEYATNRGSYKGYGRLKREAKRMDIKEEIQRLQEKKDPELKRRREIFKRVEDTAYEKGIKEKYFPKLIEEEKKKKKSSKIKEVYRE